MIESAHASLDDMDDLGLSGPRGGGEMGWLGPDGAAVGSQRSGDSTTGTPLSGVPLAADADVPDGIALHGGAVPTAAEAEAATTAEAAAVPTARLEAGTPPSALQIVTVSPDSVPAPESTAVVVVLSATLPWPSVPDCSVAVGGVRCPSTPIAPNVLSVTLPPFDPILMSGWEATRGGATAGA